ncbi:hypothetical protein CRG98_006064, partial [Punica granatum]
HGEHTFAKALVLPQSIQGGKRLHRTGQPTFLVTVARCTDSDSSSQIVALYDENCRVIR